MFRGSLTHEDRLGIVFQLVDEILRGRESFPAGNDEEMAANIESAIGWPKEASARTVP